MMEGWSSGFPRKKKKAYAAAHRAPTFLLSETNHDSDPGVPFTCLGMGY